MQGLVERWELENRLNICVSVKDKREDGQSCIDGCISQHQESIVNWNGHEVEEDDEDGLDHGDDETSMEHELGEDG